MAQKVVIQIEAETSQAVNSIDKLGDEYNELARRAAKANEELKKLKKEGADPAIISKQQATVKELNKGLRNLEKNATGAQKGSNRLAKAFGSGLIAATGFLGVVTLVVDLLKFGFNVVKDFEQGVADLSAVAATSSENIERLSEQAKELGASTQFTAAEVLKLQGELAKLGFDAADEIPALTADVLNLAAATGVELDEAAKIAGATIRQFGLDASEAGRVADVFAIASARSAVDTKFLADSLKTVGPAANAAGVSLEGTVALIGKLADSGLDASSSGTALRNILIELSASTEFTGTATEKLDQAFAKIRNSTDALTTANDLFGKRSAVAAVILAGQAQEAAILQEQLENNGIAQADVNQIIETANEQSAAYGEELKAQGKSQEEVTAAVEEYRSRLIELGKEDGFISAADVAAERNDTLQGSITKLGSAFQGLILTFTDGGGFLQSIFEGLAFYLTETGKAFGPVIDLVKQLFRDLGDLIGVGDSNIDWLQIFSKAIEIATLPLKIFIRAISVVINGLRALINWGKQAANFFGAEFEIDPDATDRFVNSVDELVNGTIDDVKSAFTIIEKSQEEVAKLTIQEVRKLLEKGNELTTETTKLLNERLELLEEQERAAQKEKDDALKAKVEARFDGDLLAIQERITLLRSAGKSLSEQGEKELAILIGLRDRVTAAVNEANRKDEEAAAKTRDANKKKRDAIIEGIEDEQEFAKLRENVASGEGGDGLTDNEIDSIAKLQQKREEDLALFAEGSEQRLQVEQFYAQQIQEVRDGAAKRQKETFKNELAALEEEKAARVLFLENKRVAAEQEAEIESLRKTALEDGGISPEEQLEIENALLLQSVANKKAAAEKEKQDKIKALEEQRAIIAEDTTITEEQRQELQAEIDEQIELEKEIHQENLTEIEREALEKRNENQEEFNEKEKARLEALEEFRLNTLSDGLSAASDLVGAFAGKSKKAQRQAFEIQKGIALVQTAIETQQAAQKAYTSQLIPGDPTSPVRAAVAAAIAVAGGVARVATIASQQPPAFAQGGLVQGPGTGTSDSIPARLSNGEFVIRASVVEGNEDFFRALNAGQLTPTAPGQERREETIEETYSTIIANRATEPIQATISQTEVARGLRDQEAFERKGQLR